MKKRSTRPAGAPFPGLPLALLFLAGSAWADSAPEQSQPPVKVDTKKDKAGERKPAEPEGWHRDGLELKNGKSKIGLAGYVQADFRSFDWEPKETDLGRLRAKEREVRRSRIGVEGNLGDLSFEFVIDPRNSQVGDRLKDLTLGYSFSKRFNLLVGHFKPQVSQEFLTSASKTDLVDRTMIANLLAPDRDWGAGVSGRLGRVSYDLGGFAGDGAASLQSAKTSGAGRLKIETLKGLTLGASFMQGKVAPDARVGTREPSPKGALGRTTTGFTFWDRPHVNGVRRRLGGDLSYTRGPFRFQAEYLQSLEQRLGQGSTGQDIPDVRGRGWSAQASYLLTGEKKGSTVTPEKSLFRGGKGALEIIARAETIKFDDTGDPSGFAGYGNRTRNIAPSGASVIGAGLNYWASSFLKFQGNAIWESYNDPLIAPIPGNKGRYFTLIGRIQVMIP